MKKLRLICFLGLMLAASIPSPAQTAAEAKATVEKFYKFHRARSGIISTHELNLRKPWLTPELIRLFRYELKREDEFVKKNPDEKPYFGDGFPFQPYEECVVDEKIILNRLEIGEVRIEKAKALVEVRFFIPPECEKQTNEKLLETYRLELLKSGSRWLINDWLYADGKRLTGILKREKY
jgi:hypothetical protein